ncbi:hypothetical protein [Pseudobacteriovorax antillogorgiicola]|uniref:Uncharacterized protein n=1 Tax=Pseudobacteriovorax antillogorgiicola TaxID=1513793 RepID=A0A1Y6BKX2_9BACT|nr:hypothetical protein [Pseudobacteriovorax antillogorgiicola]TCS56194.1 hypothetical protein EDD56_10416 [Pseudobacteriovorax antillogorgiicola]SMF08754.1 hypothetical protein SAMN06296036_104318 [Pseudobacteriovorax antillogorgiicola]
MKPRYGIVLVVLSCSREPALQETINVDLSALHQIQFLSYSTGSDLLVETCFSESYSAADRPLTKHMQLSVNGSSVNSEDQVLDFCNRVGYPTTLESSTFFTISSEILDSESNAQEETSYDFKVDRIAPAIIFEGIDLVYSLGVGLFSLIEQAQVSVTDEQGVVLYVGAVSFDASSQIASISIPQEVFATSSSQAFDITTSVSYRYAIPQTNQLASSQMIISIQDVLTLNRP